MKDDEVLAERFEVHRQHVRGVALRLLGSVHDADDAVQETWLRLSRTDTSDVQNLRGWLTTVVGRICLDILRTRAARNEEPLEWHVPDPIVRVADSLDPEQEALLAESVGLALDIVLETLAPAERLAFVLHDLFAIPFEEIGTLLGRSANAAKQLASRARRRVQAASPALETDLRRQHAAVDAFFAAARHGDFVALVALLDPNVTLRADGGTGRQGLSSAVVRGAAEVAGRALLFARPAARVSHAVVNGAAGVVITIDHQPLSVMGFTVSSGRIIAIAALIDSDRLALLDLSAFVDA